MDDLFVREDLLDRYHVDEIRVKEFKDVYSFNPPSADKLIKLNYNVGDFDFNQINGRSEKHLRVFWVS